ncbi:MAG: hypothetical protein QQN55_09025 [Nitrosopumilus sp.]
MPKVRYRVSVYIDVFVEKDSPSFEKHMARHEALKIIHNIPYSHLGEVKPLPHGSENILRKENEI